MDLEGALAGPLGLATAREESDSNDKKAALFGAADLQSKLVAGAGFEPAAFRL